MLSWVFLPKPLSLLTWSVSAASRSCSMVSRPSSRHRAADFLRPDALDAQHLDHAGRGGVEQALQVGERAGIEQLGHFGGGGFAQAGAVGQAGALHLGHREAQGIEGSGRAFHGADFKGVFVV